MQFKQLLSKQKKPEPIKALAFAFAFYETLFIDVVGESTSVNTTSKQDTGLLAFYCCSHIFNLLILFFFFIRQAKLRNLTSFQYAPS